MTICVAHLVRKQNGIEPFLAFLNSYLGHPTGIDHQLLILFKGFSDDEDISEYKAALIDIRYNYIMLLDAGYDLGSYLTAVKKTNFEYYCFLNSFSIILGDNWLLKMFEILKKPGVGIVGATGSWQSIATGFPFPKKNSPLWKLLLQRLYSKLAGPYYSFFFHRFPNPHIRSNAFMVSRAIICKIKYPRLRFKMDAIRLESGRDSLTRQIESMGLSSLVVGNNGESYPKNLWNKSGTFMNESQSNLLVADNRTQKYNGVCDTERERFRKLVWGE